MKTELCQVDILKIECVKNPVLVVSKDFFNQSFEIIACPIFEIGEPSPLHIHIKTDNVAGYIVKNWHFLICMSVDIQ